MVLRDGSWPEASHQADVLRESCVSVVGGEGQGILVPRARMKLKDSKSLLVDSPS